MTTIKERRINRETGYEKISIHETTYFSVDSNAKGEFYAIEYRHGGTGKIVTVDKCVPTFGESINYFDYYDDSTNEGVVLEVVCSNGFTF